MSIVSIHDQAARPRGLRRLGERWVPWAIWAALVPTALLTAAAAVIRLWLEYRTSPPSCYGIGWGCQLDPWSAGALWLVIFCLPAIVVSGMVLGLTELAGPRFAFVRSVLMVLVHICGIAYATWLIGQNV